MSELKDIPVLANIPVNEMTRQQAMERLTELQRKYSRVQEEVRGEIEEVCDAHGLTCYIGDYGYGQTYYPEGWNSSSCEWDSSDESGWVSSSDLC